MSENIRSANVLVCDAAMLASDVSDLLAEHKVDLPEVCFLRTLAEYAAPTDLVRLDPTRLRWFGEWSGHSYFKVFLPHVAPKIRGTLEVIWTWSEGVRGLRIRDGVVTEPDVVMSLKEET